MGNWHCVENGCGRVSWREYLPPSIRYRYPGEDWVTVEGDNFTCVPYCPNSGTDYYYVNIYFNVVDLDGKIKIDNKLYSTYRYDSYNNFLGRDFRVTVPYNSYDGVNWPHLRLTYFDLEHNEVVTRKYVIYRSKTAVMTLNSYQVINFKNDIPCLYRFTVYDADGGISHTQTKEKCPEVEKIDECLISDTSQEIKIEKKPYLEKIQVVDNFSNLFIGSNIEQYIKEQLYGEIPQNCRQIWKTPIADLPNLEGIIDIFTDFLFPDSLFPNPNGNTIFNEHYQLIKQICSAPGCPPPEYKVTCDCDCESCPDGTCAVICDDHVCCADKVTGKAIKEIPLEDYCEEGN